MHLEHVNITVKDLDRSIDFYTRLLGAKLRWRRTNPDEGRIAAHIGDDTAYLALFQAENTNNAPDPDYESPGINHLGFVVDDLEAAQAFLESQGITPHLDDTYDPGRHLYFMDPDGIEVELVHYAPSAKQPSPVTEGAPANA